MLNRIDLTRPTAPELAFHGPHPVGARTLHLVNPDQVDVLNSADRICRKDRALTVELWYPARPGSGRSEPYQSLLRDGHRPVTLRGAARREALAAGEGFPLVILSHGWPGTRLLMSHLGEKLASHGYVVAAIDHLDSTYADKAVLASTLVNRPLDTEFVRQSLAGHADNSTTAIIGFSMGGYGALVSAGAAVSRDALTLEAAPPAKFWGHCLSPQVSPALKAILPIGPWGRQRGLWSAEGLAGIRVPMLIMAGSADEVSGYTSGIRPIFAEAVNARRHLLTFINAGHNAAAPHPSPAEAWEPSPHLDFHPFEHYADPVWDTLTMNNIAQHFALAFLDRHLKGQGDRDAFLSSDFKGFPPGTAQGLTFESLLPA
ncbi:MAG: dienelactone hydrolase [Tabrizicola sp.]|nr:dienelactone hydrolase [Tabrizicola sp.]